MRHDEERNEPDPAEVQPTDNSSGVPIDPNRVEEIQEESPGGDT